VDGGILIGDFDDQRHNPHDGVPECNEGVHQAAVRVLAGLVGEHEEGHFDELAQGQDQAAELDAAGLHEALAEALKYVLRVVLAKVVLHIHVLLVDENRVHPLLRKLVDEYEHIDGIDYLEPQIERLLPRERKFCEKGFTRPHFELIFVSH